MPSSRDIKDWIPVGGEGRVLAEIKGKVGRSNMRRGYFRGRRGGGRFRYSRRSQRYWVPHFSQDGSGVAQFQGYELPALVANITPMGDVDTENIQSTDYGNGTFANPVARLLMLQGSIPVMMHLTGSEEDWTNGLSSRVIPMCRLFYWWSKVKDTASGFTPPESFQDSGTGQRVWSASPNAQFGALQDLMLRKDVISWGWKTLRPYASLGIQFAYNGTAVQGYSDKMDQFSSLAPNQFIPLPRIPRKGLSFYTGDRLACYAVLTRFDFGGQIPAQDTGNNAAISIVTDDSPGAANVNFLPLFRALFVR